MTVAAQKRKRANVQGVLHAGPAVIAVPANGVRGVVPVGYVQVARKIRQNLIQLRQIKNHCKKRPIPASAVL